MTPFRAPADYQAWDQVAALIHASFAYMEPLLGHPPSAATVTHAQLANAAQTGSVCLIEDAGQPIACLFTRPSRDLPDALYLGWLAVDGRYRGGGLARRLIDIAEVEARAGGYAAMTLDTGRALTGLIAYFRVLGFNDLPGDGPVVSFRKDLT